MYARGAMLKVATTASLRRIMVEVEEILLAVVGMENLHHEVLSHYVEIGNEIEERMIMHTGKDPGLIFTRTRGAK